MSYTVHLNDGHGAELELSVRAASVEQAFQKAYRVVDRDHRNRMYSFRIVAVSAA